MRRVSLASVLVLAGLMRAAEVAPIPPATPPSSGSIETTAVIANANSVPAKRVVSPATAAKLAAAAPVFQPPAVVSTPEPESPIIQVSDKPRNQIIRLPNFFVAEPKLRVPAPYQVLTPKGRVELAFARQPGLRFVPFGWMNTGIALEMLEDDLRKQRRREAADLMSLYLIK